MTYKKASSVIEKYLKCRNEPCIDNRECNYCEYETSWKEQDEAFKLAIKTLRNAAAELISWLDECISDERTTPIERATLTAVKCKVEGEG